MHTERLEGAAISYEFAVPADHPDAATIAPEGYVIIRDLDGNLQQFRIKTVETGLSSQGERVRRVTAENAALELNGEYVRPATWTGVTAAQALANALTGTRWAPGQVEWLGSRTITIDGYKTVTEVLLQIASEFGGELRWRVEWRDGRIVARYVDLLQRRGRRTGKRFEYAKDIEGLKRIEDTTELVTAMIGVGQTDENGNRLTFADVTWSRAKGDPADKPAGQDWVGDLDALQRWGLPGGRHIFGLYDDPDEADPQRLLQKTWDALQARINSRYTYEIDVAVLERVAGLEHEAVRLGDTITVHDYTVDPPLILEARVVEIQRSYVDPSRDKVTLGHYQPVITSLPQAVADLQRRLNQRQGMWDSKETPSGAQAKAEAAKQQAIQAVASGSVPLPTSALQGAIDAARNAIESTASHVTIDEDGITVYDHPDPAQATRALRLAAGAFAIANSRDSNGNWEWRTFGTGDGFVADLIAAGTMLFDRLRGGTAELGGPGNGNGLLIVRDASGQERARLDNEGVSVTEGHFLLHDAITQVPSSIAHATNLVRDHSFETIPRLGTPDSHHTYQVDTSLMGDQFWWWFSGAEAPRVLSTYGAGAGQLARFDFQAAVLRYWDRTMWRQRVPLDQTVGLAGPYTFSAWFAAFSATTVDTTAYGELRAVNASGSSFQTVGFFTVPIKASEKWVWKRGYVTVRDLPANTAYLEIRLYCVPDSMILCDGVQIVPLDRPAVYDPESALWRAIRELPGYRRAEQLPRVRLTRTSNFAVPQSTPTAISWQARRSGYTTANFWDPNQPDRTIVTIPESGLYIVSVNVRWQSSGSGYRGITIQKNGSINIVKEQLPAAAVQDTYQEVTTPHLFNAGDTIRVIVVHNSNDGTLSIIKEDEVSPELTIARIF
ncbi:MAG: hypothetical protein DIU69_07815 [Bacillota bacterium]|nr:MAG: hypothetical protein DIU69_07815 [Bacillota bacterium]